MANSLAQAVSQIDLGEPYYIVFSEFHDRFVAVERTEARVAMLADEPCLTGNRRLDTLAAALAHYLAGQYRLPAVPPWTRSNARTLEEPWHTSSVGIDCTREFLSDAMREYLTFSSPAEFASRNIFTEERPLRRARGLQST